jgi:hypothetical protein
LVFLQALCRTYRWIDFLPITNSTFAIVDPITIIKGIVLKIIVISYLIYSIKVAKNERSGSQSNEILDQIKKKG